MAGGRKYPNYIKNIFHWTGKAISDFQMIGDGDRIVVGVSGVDSLCLLWTLRERLRWIPIKYELKAVYIDLGFDEEFGQIIEDCLKKEAYDYGIFKTNIGREAHGPVNRKNPCFYCSMKRKRKLFSLARDWNCNKIALGHHLEDINATLFLNILYGGAISAMLPRQEFFGGKVAIIRPLALAYKEQIEKMAASLGLPPINNPCPSSKTSQRKEVDDFLRHFYKKYPRVHSNIFRAMRNVNKDYLPR